MNLRTQPCKHRIASASTSKNKFHCIVALCATLALGACQRSQPDAPWLGYAEGEYVQIAAPVAGRLTALPVARGDQVVAGQALFTLEQENERAALQEAEARFKQAEAQLADLQTGRRPDEIRVAAEQLEQARAALKLSAAQLQRQRALIAQGFVSSASLDSANASQESNRARVEELQAQLATMRLPARSEAIAAAQAQVEAARQVVAQNQWRVEQKNQTAPVAGRIENTFYRVGEYVDAGAPVLALLPPDALKLRFYVPENAVAGIALGQNVAVHCDGCGADIPVRVSFIANQSEYTPPLIYSKENRAKLVFLIEARPAAEDAARLRPGLPVEVRVQAGAAVRPAPAAQESKGP